MARVWRTSPAARSSTTQTEPGGAPSGRGASRAASSRQGLQLAAANSLAGGEDVYFKVIRGKTAALFEAATQSGAMVSGASPDAVEALRAYGDSLGLAFQIADDLLDYGGASAALGKNSGDDFREGKATLPVILEHERADEAGRAFWRRVIERREQTADDLETAVALMERSGALADARARADAYAARARDALSIFPDTPLRAAMSDIADFMVSRAH